MPVTSMAIVPAPSQRWLPVQLWPPPMQFWPQVAFHKLRVMEIPVRLIYNDPTRHFGGTLDDPDNRLRHYLDVMCQEQKRIVEQSSPRSWLAPNSGVSTSTSALRVSCCKR